MRTNIVADPPPDHPVVMVFMSYQIKYRQMYEQEIKGKASTDAAMSEALHAKENAENFSQVWIKMS